MLSTSDKVVAYRHKFKMTQAELAELLGVSKATVTTREAGTTSWRLDELGKLATYFECQVSDLVGG